MAAIPELDRSLESAYREHSPALLRRARRWLPPDEAEDLVQETFLRAWMHHGSSNPGVPWMMTVLRNLAIDRSRRIHPELTDDPASLETGSGIDETAEKVVALEDRRRVREALASLTSQQRAVITLREWAGMSQQEIAESLDTTVPSVESLLLRGRRRLKRALAQGFAVVLWPTSELWRKVKGVAIHPATGSPGAVAGWQSTVASLATAATVVAAGAAAPLGAGRNEPPPTDRVPVVMSAGDGIETTPTEHAAASGGHHSGDGASGTAAAASSDSTTSGGTGASTTGTTSDGETLRPKTDGPKPTSPTENLESDSDPAKSDPPSAPQDDGDAGPQTGERPESTDIDRPDPGTVAASPANPSLNS